MTEKFYEVLKFAAYFQDILIICVFTDYLKVEATAYLNNKSLIRAVTDKLGTVLNIAAFIKKY